MSVTIFVDIAPADLVTKPVRMVEQYPGLDNQDFANEGYAQDEQGFYFSNEPDYDGCIEANFSNANFASLLRAIDGNMAVLSASNDGCGCIEAGDVSAFTVKVLKALNSSKLDSFTREPVEDRNIFSFGIDRAYLERALSKIAEVCAMATKLGKGINWG